MEIILRMLPCGKNFDVYLKGVSPVKYGTFEVLRVSSSNGVRVIGTGLPDWMRGSVFTKALEELYDAFLAGQIVGNEREYCYQLSVGAKK